MYQTQLHDDEFSRFQRWLHQTAGIELSPAKKALVASRLAKRLCHYELDSYDDYFQLIMNDRCSELQLALDLLTTNETYFFREPKHFEFLTREVLARFPSERTLRIWSAASSSGSICTFPLSKAGLQTGTISSPNRNSACAPGQFGPPQ